jgi:hypothetical protein
MLRFLGMRLAVLVGVFVAISGCLHAQDGVILINQSNAITGGVTPGDTPGFPVTISKPGSYKLSSNLVLADPNGTGIQITASNVTLDLNGFNIIGANVCSVNAQSAAVCPTPGQGVGVQAGTDETPGPRSVTVRNGSVRGMSLNGIQLTGDGSMIERVASDGNFKAGFDVNGSVTQSSATGNGFDGFRALVVRDSISVNNRRFGILIRSGGGAATGDIASFNGNDGISAANSRVIGNTVVSNMSTGNSALCPSNISDNTVVNNGGNSIETTQSGCVVINNATGP